MKEIILGDYAASLNRSVKTKIFELITKLAYSAVYATLTILKQAVT